MFVKPAAGWANATETAKLPASDGAAGDQLGFSVAVSGDTVVAGANLDDVGANAEQGKEIKKISGDRYPSRTEQAKKSMLSLPLMRSWQRWISRAP